MYRHYESSEDVFVDREEFIEWMDEALVRCKKKSVVLYLKGIGGIGKSSLLNHWVNRHEKSIRLDCYQYSDFFQRLNILAKGAVLHGIKLQRFDILWQIRQRFVEGVEPVREEGREWAKEIVMAIPFIGSLATIGSAITVVGAKVTPKLKGKYGTIGKWLQEQLGKNHIETLLGILWKDPRRAEFLYISALVEDINSRENLETPVLFLFDHFEHVDDEKTLWKYMKKRINESELWTVFLSNLSNCVGVLASRKPAMMKKEVDLEESELLELDRDSCLEMLELQDVVGKELQDRIVSVSGGNPFVIDTICDMINTSDVSISDMESFRAETLSEVRLKVWRRLFSQAEGLHSLINRAGMLPYFNEQIMSIIAPEMTPENWDRLRRLSFVREREDGTFVLHELAQELVKAELGGKLHKLAHEVCGLLEKVSEEWKDYELLGLSLSVQALADDEFNIAMKIDSVIDSLLFHSDTTNALKCLDTLKTDSDPILIHKDVWRGYVLLCTGRISEAEDTTLNTLESALELAKQGRLDSIPYLGAAYFFQARLYQGTGRYYEAEEAFRNAMKIVDEFTPQNPHEMFVKADYSTGINYWLGVLLSVVYRLNEAEKLIRKAIEIYYTEYWKPYYSPDEVQGWLRIHQSGLAQVLNYSGKISEAEKILRNTLETCEESVNRVIALEGLYSTLRFQHRHNDQLEVLEQLLEKRKQLAEKIPDHQFLVVETLGLIALPLVQTGQCQKAEKIYRDIIEKYRLKVNEEPGHLTYFAKVLQDFGTLLALSDRLQKAEATTLEVVELLREPAQVYPERYNQKLATGLNNLGIIRMHMEKIGNAKETLLEAYDIAKENSIKHDEAVYLAEIYAIITNNIGAHFGIINQWENAERYLKEVYNLLNTRVSTTPTMFLPHLATVKNNMGILLCETNRVDEAESELKKALEIRKEYVERSENFFLPKVASVLNNLGIYCMRIGKSKESKKMYKKALDIMESFADKEPTVHQSAYTQILNNSLVLYSKTNDSGAVESTRARLRELGIEEPLSKERWFVDAEYL